MIRCLWRHENGRIRQRKIRWSSTGIPGNAPTSTISYDSSADLGQGSMGLMSTTLNVPFDHLFFDKTAGMVSKYPHLSGTAKTSIVTGTPAKLQIEGYEGGHVLVDNFADDDYMVQFTANLNSGKKVVALVRYEDQNNHYFVEIGSGASNNVRLYEMVSGKPTSIGSPGTATTTGDVNVKIKLAGNIIKVWVGGTLEINESPGTFASGGVGFTSDIAQFWDIKVGYDDNGDDDIDDAGDDVFYDDDFTTTSVTVVYDDNGNLTDDGTFKYVYDAWNRLVQVKSSSDDDITIATYTYDALGRRIRKVVTNRGELDGTTLYYYNQRWQLLETRDGSESLDMQIVHGTQYIDEIVRFGKVGRGEMFVYQDANWNVTSAVGFSGIVLDRVTTTPYGQPTFHTYTVNGDYDGDGDLDASDDSNFTTCKIAMGNPTPACRTFDYDLDGDVDTADEVHFDNLYPGSDVITRRMGQESSFNGLIFAHQGLMLDSESSMFQNRYRVHSVSSKRFLQRDPRFVFGNVHSFNVDEAFLYNYEWSSPANLLDPYGDEPASIILIIVATVAAAGTVIAAIIGNANSCVVGSINVVTYPSGNFCYCRTESGWLRRANQNVSTVLRCQDGIFSNSMEIEHSVNTCPCGDDSVVPAPAQLGDPAEPNDNSKFRSRIPNHQRIRDDKTPPFIGNSPVLPDHTQFFGIDDK